MKKYSVFDIKPNNLFECDLKRECAPIFNRYYTNTEIINYLEENNVIRGDFSQKRLFPDDTGPFSLYFNSEGAINSFIERLNSFLESQASLAVPHTIELDK